MLEYNGQEVKEIITSDKEVIELLGGVEPENFYIQSMFTPVDSTDIIIRYNNIYLIL